MRNEANREVYGAAAVRECETKPIRRGGGARQECLGHRCGTKPPYFRYRTGVERFARRRASRDLASAQTPGIAGISP